MTPEQLSRIEEAFHAALTQPPAEREDYLHHHEPDPNVRTAVRRLLKYACEDSMDPVSAGLSHLFAGVSATPQMTIGTYRLIRELGSGGMGTVFLAERDAGDAVQRVALKLMHGIPTRASNRRLARERGLLASLDHPLIARHIDGGVTAEGQPFLVMDYIEGVSFPEYIATMQPTLHQRLQMFLRLCEAVQHAHQRLVLHRDIKPSNVMVRKDGTPVLVDFGVGTLLVGEEVSARTMVTPFTPGYGAPEQRRGESATTATDVFCLGSLLFDVLTDRKLSELRIGSQPVPAPSDHVQTAAARRVLRGDLDRIVLAACAEAPEDRYATVSALAGDIQRYLLNKPVSVTAGRHVYRLKKFVMRHRLASCFTVIALTAISLFVWQLNMERHRALAAEAASLQSAQRAEHEAAYSEASRRFLASVLSETSPSEVRGGAITISALLGGATKKLQDDRTLDDATRAITWLSIAEVYDQIDSPQAGLHAADSALSLYDKAHIKDPDLHARLLGTRSSLLGRLGRYDEAMKIMQELIATREKEHLPAVALANLYADYVGIALQASAEDVANTYAQRALALLKESDGNAPDTKIKVLLDMVVLQLDAENLPAAENYLQAAVSTANQAWSQDNAEWYTVYRLTAQLRQAQRRYAVALANAQHALAIAYRSYGDESRNTMEMENDLATIFTDMGRPQEAVIHSERSLRMGQKLDLDPTTLAMLKVNIGNIYGDLLGDHKRAVEYLGEAIAVFDSIHRPDSTLDIWRFQALIKRMVSYSDLDQFEKARADFQRALPIAGAMKDTNAAIGLKLRYTEALIHAGHLSEARETLDNVKKALEGSGTKGQSFNTAITTLEADYAFKQGDLKAASGSIRQALDSAAVTPGYTAVRLAGLKVRAAEIAIAQGDFVHARTLLGEARPVLQSQMSPVAPALVKAQQLVKKLPHP